MRYSYGKCGVCGFYEPGNIELSTLGDWPQHKCNACHALGAESLEDCEGYLKLLDQLPGWFYEVVTFVRCRGGGGIYTTIKELM